jgi:hypothetical protein
MPFSAAAWALPRPSATASAKLANSTVNQSQRVMARMNPGGFVASGLALARQRLDKEARGEQAAQPDHEHDRILHLVAGDRRFTASQAATLSRAAS